MGMSKTPNLPKLAPHGPPEPSQVRAPTLGPPSVLKASQLPNNPQRGVPLGRSGPPKMTTQPAKPGDGTLMIDPTSRPGSGGGA